MLPNLLFLGPNLIFLIEKREWNLTCFEFGWLKFSDELLYVCIIDSHVSSVMIESINLQTKAEIDKGRRKKNN